MVQKGLCRQACLHPKRNRYCNQFPLDSHLVEVPGVDYINASRMDLPGWSRQAIITGGPLHPKDFSGGNPSDFGDQDVPDTCGDFWRMVAAEGAEVIVMLCTLAPGYQGCSRYFPQSSSHETVADDVRARQVGEYNGDGYLMRSIEVRIDRGDPFVVRHYQFLLWPNYGVPKEATQLAAMTKNVIEANPKKMIIHCSGGLGRSGTFLAIFYAHALAMSAAASGVSWWPEVCPAEGGLELLPLVWKMRSQRHPWMVEGHGQYRIAHQTLELLLAEELREGQPL